MRIKINDTIYRLKEIESGVDSLMELVEEPKFKDSDFVKDAIYGAICIYHDTNESGGIVSHAGCYNGYITTKTSTGWGYTEDFRIATEEEKQVLIDFLAKEGKMWNEEKKCIEDIPKCKFKKGDKVMLKSGCKDAFGLSYFSEMDKWIGKPITVYRCQQPVFIYDFDDCPFHLHEYWLEPVEELKKGDLAIFWDNEKKIAVIKSYDRSIGSEEDYFLHKDQNGFRWRNAIKFESKEQYEKLIKGEL